MSPRGRRPAGSPDARQAILDSARRAFARQGYQASLRGVAREAGVDPALIHHYFPDRAALFAQAVIADEAGVPLDLSERIAAVAALPPERIGEGVVRSFVSLWDEVGGDRFAAVLRAALESPGGLEPLRDYLTEGVLASLAGSLSPDRARLRAQLISSQILGLGMARWVGRMDQVAGLDVEQAVALIGPTIQRYAHGELPGAQGE
ncbi:TetR family transcriptional regulator [Actinomyces bowdenii]|uniref:TetR/AcrR family transcriptional regulator n=1 Tax=Actinomyces bowdenii TaxID=131109 RepID=UPI001ABCECAE|nr:TetR family transcriptional regulator [Actinomyces bowdenii]MBO3723992.1 TetR family transcriptional regulator [Actinomyces bowdenii]